MLKGKCVLVGITGGIAAAYYGVPDDIVNKAMKYLKEDVRYSLEVFNCIANSRVISDEEIDLGDDFDEDELDDINDLDDDIFGDIDEEILREIEDFEGGNK